MGKRKKREQQAGEPGRSGQALSYADADPRGSAPTRTEAIKRRKISYASDDDVNDNTPAPAFSRPKVSYAPSNTSSEDDRPQRKAATPAGPYSYTAEKRRSLYAKGAHKDGDASGGTQTRATTTVVYGQTGAFPGLDEHDEEEFYGPADDGLGYLRMVRSEARGLPDIVTAASRGDEASKGRSARDSGSQDAGEQDYGYEYDEDDDEEGYYSDGAYIARPIAVYEPASSDQDPQSVYHDSLCARFAAVRARLGRQPDPGAVTALDARHPISFPRRSKHAAREWKHLLRTTDPHPAQLAAMDTPMLIRLLQAVLGQLQLAEHSKTNVSRQLAVWTWALLGRLPVMGELHTDYVVVVRDLAKVAIWVSYAYRKMAADKMDVYRLEYFAEDDDGYDDEDLEEADAKGGASGGIESERNALQAARDDLLNGLDDGQGQLEMSGEASRALEPTRRSRPTMDDVPGGSIMSASGTAGDHTGGEEVPDLNTLATLDMIITVAGEFYGQKDLLSARLAWEQEA